jgi:hypothetical protein
LLSCRGEGGKDICFAEFSGLIFKDFEKIELHLKAERTNREKNSLLLTSHIANGW